MFLSARKTKREDATKRSFKGHELHLVSTRVATHHGSHARSVQGDLLSRADDTAALCVAQKALDLLKGASMWTQFHAILNSFSAVPTNSWLFRMRSMSKMESGMIANSSFWIPFGACTSMGYRFVAVYVTWKSNLDFVAAWTCVWLPQLNWPTDSMNVASTWMHWWQLLNSATFISIDLREEFFEWPTARSFAKHYWQLGLAATTWMLTHLS